MLQLPCYLVRFFETYSCTVIVQLSLYNFICGSAELHGVQVISLSGQRKISSLVGNYATGAVPLMPSSCIAH